jgi:hypothetical protein
MARRRSKGSNQEQGYLVALLCLAVAWAFSSTRKRQEVVAGTAPLAGGAAQSLQTYLRSALTLREIHSLKLTHAEKWSERLKFALIGISTAATCIGFVGVHDLATDLGVGDGVVNSVMNLFLLLLLIAVIAELAWRFGDRASEHQRAIVVLTGFIRDLENRLRQPIANDDTALVHEFGERHALIIEILPAHTDQDYLRAKEAAAKKDATKRKIRAESQ